MKRKILFIHSAGKQDSLQGSCHLINYLKLHLDKEYSIIVPRMPDPENPRYDAWKRVLEIELEDADQELLLIGHSLGASIIAEYLIDEKVNIAACGLMLIAAPHWGEVDWEIEEFQLKTKNTFVLPNIGNVFLYHSCDDQWVPFSHMGFYIKNFLNAKVRVLEGSEHLFSSGLPQLLKDIRSLSKLPVEIFRTDVEEYEFAKTIIAKIESNFGNYKATFDLEDCDRILRVQALTGVVNSIELIDYLWNLGVCAEVLEDAIPV